MKKNIFVTVHDGAWAVKEAGKAKAITVVPTQKEAISVAKPIAKAHQTDLIIQGRDGKIRTCNSYGNDPCPPKDKNR